MLAPNRLAEVLAVLGEESFYRADHRLIFRAIVELDAKGSPFDAVTLGEWIEAKALSERIGGTGYLIELASGTPSAANIRSYANIVQSKYLLRQVIEIGSELVGEGFNPDGKTPEEVLDSAVVRLMSVSKQAQNYEFTIKQASRMAWDDAEIAYKNPGKMRGITTGFARMDARLGGFHKSDLVILGARPSMGKTALMVNLALSAAAAGHGVGMISGEQSALQIGQRSIAVVSKVPAEVMRQGTIQEEHWPRLTDAMQKLIGHKVRIYDRSAPTLEDICRVARRWKQEHGMEILFVDYLQRIRYPKAGNRIDEVSEVARGLKTLARDLEIPVVALAQVKAEVDKREDKRPGLGDVANSDEATREADQIAFLYRGEVYDPSPENAGLAELNLEKNRHGPTGTFDLHFNAETMFFADLEGRYDRQR
jgi:replicative DNA helicase